MKSSSSRRSRSQESILHRRIYGIHYLPGLNTGEKYWSGKRKMVELVRLGYVTKKEKGYSLTPDGFLIWIVSRGAPRGWGELNPEQQRRWTNKIIEYVMARHRHRFPGFRVVLRDPAITQVETGRPRKFALSVDQDIYELSEKAYRWMGRAKLLYEELNLSPNQQKKYLQKVSRIANLYTILVNVHAKIMDGEVTFE